MLELRIGNVIPNSQPNYDDVTIFQLKITIKEGRAEYKSVSICQSWMHNSNNSLLNVKIGLKIQYQCRFNQLYTWNLYLMPLSILSCYLFPMSILKRYFSAYLLAQSQCCCHLIAFIMEGPYLSIIFLAFKRNFISDFQLPC